MIPSALFRDDVLSGQVAIVTGGGTGIGAACARELTRLGAQVVIAARDNTRLCAAAEGLSAELVRPVLAVPCDIRDRDAVDKLVATTLERLGRVDLLVNNGGGQFLAPAETIRPKGFDAVVATNLTGTWNLTRAVADQWMLDHGGRIVNITMLTSRGFPGMAHSVAARAGVEAMTRTLAIEWASRGILVNALQPGLILSSGLGNYPGGAELVQGWQSNIPLKRLGTVEDVAWMVAFLASPAGRYITGQVLCVDGGYSLWGQTWPIADPDPLPAVEIPSEPWEDQ
jgi:NAD(P)-dependent dehydrogenase (short-subunit alcohol dehydrogenase family)